MPRRPLPHRILAPLLVLMASACSGPDLPPAPANATASTQPPALVPLDGLLAQADAGQLTDANGQSLAARGAALRARAAAIRSDTQATP